ncbi:MAG TPA: YhcH/YjgK/YiaL family protein [Vicinamibacterales bacterium]|nr:YhcH/YjgK/YiaL family protein [Vicinamibacterales bacterium]
MVSDDIKYAPEYFNLSAGIRTALEYLRRADLGALTPGRHDVDGDRVFALVSDYETRSAAETFWEAHRRHVDVQYVHSGVERIGYGDLADFAVEPYDAERDLVVARGDSERFVEVGPRGFVILFPHDVHMPGLTGRRIETVRKVVVKVRLAGPDA